MVKPSPTGQNNRKPLGIRSCGRSNLEEILILLPEKGTRPFLLKAISEYIVKKDSKKALAMKSWHKAIEALLGSKDAHSPNEVVVQNGIANVEFSGGLLRFDLRKEKETLKFTFNNKPVIFRNSTPPNGCYKIGDSVFDWTESVLQSFDRFEFDWRKPPVAWNKSKNKFAVGQGVNSCCILDSKMLQAIGKMSLAAAKLESPVVFASTRAYIKKKPDAEIRYNFNFISSPEFDSYVLYFIVTHLLGVRHIREAKPAKYMVFRKEADHYNRKPTFVFALANKQDPWNNCVLLSPN